jgi:alanine dehydrogenase
VTNQIGPSDDLMIDYQAHWYPKALLEARMTLFLTKGDLEDLVSTPASLEGAFAAIEKSVLDHAAGRSGHATLIQLPRTVEGKITSVYLTSSEASVSARVFPAVGSVDGLPDQHVMLLLDQSSGGLLAILAGDDLNALRSSVPACLGARYLSPPDASVLCILGSGQQARAHVAGICHVLPGITQIRVWSPTADHREAFAEWASAATGREVMIADTAADAVREADVITAAGRTRPNQPVVEASWVRPGALLISMTRGAPPDLDGKSYVPSKNRPVTVYPTTYGPAPQAGAAGGVPGLANDVAELADVIAGHAAARDKPDQTLMYDVGALYAWDAPIMRWAYEWALANGVGTDISLSAGGPGLFPTWSSR